MVRRATEKPAGNLPIVTFDADGEMQVHTTDENLKAFLFACRDSEDALEVFSKYFFNTKTKGGKMKGSFTKPFTNHRKGFARRISDTSLPFIWSMANRSFGKTTLIWAEIIRRLCFRLSPFTVYVSSELRLAEQRTEAIRIALTSNPKITEIFGKMIPEFVDGVREVWGKKAWKLVDPETGNSFAVVVPRSDNSVVNGLVDWVEGQQQRPSLILCDDVTDRKRVKDETYREEHIDWLWGTLFPCVETEIQPDPQTHKWNIGRGERPPYQIMMIDTCKHSQAAVEVAAQQPDWFGKRYAVAKETEPNSGKFVSIVEYMSDEQVQEVYDRYKRLGKEDRFFKEYLCVAGASNDSKFPTTFQYYNAADVDLNTSHNLVRFVVVDPARTSNPRSAFTAMLAVAVDCIKAKVYLRGMIHERLNYEDIGRRLCSFALENNSSILAVEDAGLHDAIRGPLEKFAQKMGLMAQWIWLPAQRKYIESEDGERRTIKEARASSALWLYRPFEPTHPLGHVWHEESLKFGPLENQMLSFPDCKGWDAIDTLGYVDYVMRELGLYFDKQVEEAPAPLRPKDPWDAILNEPALRLCG